MTRVLEIALKDSLFAWLADRASVEGVSEAEIVRRAIQRYREAPASPCWESSPPSPGLGGWHLEASSPSTPAPYALSPGEAPLDSERPIEVTIVAASPAPLRRRLTPPEGDIQAPLFQLAEKSEGRTAEPWVPSAPVLVTPCIASKKGGPREWCLSQTQLAAWEELFFDMDVTAVLKVAQGWLLSNHLKTFSGMKRFFFNWLVRAQNRGKYPKRATTRKESERPTLMQVYGFASWEEWEEKLRGYLTPEELEVDLESLGDLRRAWEARYGLG